MFQKAHASFYPFNAAGSLNTSHTGTKPTLIRRSAAVFPGARNRRLVGPHRWCLFSLLWAVTPVILGAAVMGLTCVDLMVIEIFFRYLWAGTLLGISIGAVGSFFHSIRAAVAGVSKLNLTPENPRCCRSQGLVLLALGLFLSGAALLELWLGLGLLNQWMGFWLSGKMDI